MNNDTSDKDALLIAFFNYVENYPQWMNEALCLGENPYTSSVEISQNMCPICPVRNQCLGILESRELNSKIVYGGKIHPRD